MTDIADWYKQLPRFTKYWLSLTVGISLLAKIGILPDFYLVLFWDFVWRKFQVKISLDIIYRTRFEVNYPFFLDMEANHSRILLSTESTDGVSFYAKLFFPLQLLTTTGTRTF